MTSPFNRGENSPKTHNAGVESSILSHKKRPIPKRTKNRQSKEDLSTAMSPMQNRDEMSRLSDMDLDVDTLANSRLKSNRLPSLGRKRNKKSAVHKSVALPESLTKKQSPPPKTSLTPRRRKPAKRDSSDLSDSLLKKL